MRFTFLLCSILFQDVGSEAENVERIRSRYDAISEVRQWDGTRIDLLNDEYAIEVDWARKWAEAVGQCLYYAELSGRKPAIVLLVTGRDDDKYVYRCQTVCAKHGIRLFVEKAE